MVELNLKSMDNKIILTIGRQFGSGGREIGQRLAKELGIGYYDKELITVAARESGLCEDVFEKADERASDNGEHHQQHAEPIQLRRAGPRADERHQHQTGYDEHDAVDRKIAPSRYQLGRQNRQRRRTRRVGEAP